MPLIIDTFNVLHTTGVLPAEAAGIDVDDLIALLQNSRYRRHRITLVCDGRGQNYADSSVCGGVEVLYSGSARPADDIIVAWIAANTAPRQLLVISSDQQILRAARRRRCPILKSAGFLHQLAIDFKAAGRTPPRSRRKLESQPRPDVKHWLEAFGIDERELKRLTTMPADEPVKAPPKEVVKQEEDDTPAKSTPKPSTKDLPGDIIEQAEQLWQKQRSPRKPSGKKSKKRAGKPARAEPNEKKEETARYDTKRLKETRVDDLSEGDARSIDMQQLMPDVKPLDSDE